MVRNLAAKLALGVFLLGTSKGSIVNSSPALRSDYLLESGKSAIVRLSFEESRALSGAKKESDDSVLFKANLKSEIADFVEKYPDLYLASDQPVCDVSTDSWEVVLPERYSAHSVYTSSKYIEQVVQGRTFRTRGGQRYDCHYYICIPGKNSRIIVDGTYRQFLQGGLEDPALNSKRNLLPEVFVGDLGELCRLFVENRDLLTENIKANILREEKTSELQARTVEKIVRDLYEAAR